MPELATIRNTQTGVDYEIVDAQARLTKAPINNPNFTGEPTAPTPAISDNSTKLATTAFVQSIADKKTNIANGVLYYKNQATVVTSSNAVFCTINNTSITAKHVVIEIYYSNPSAVTSAVSWSTTAEKLTLSGINTNANNTVTVTLALAGNL